MTRPPFNPDEDYDVAVDFIIGDRTYRRGEPFDAASVSTRMRRRLYAIGLIGTQALSQPVTVIPRSATR